MKAERELAAETTPESTIEAEDLPWVEAEVEKPAPEPRSGLRWRLALFAYRGQMGPTRHEEWRDFLPKRLR